MNVTCPKCGFEQPRDRFCANCGIDIENYRSPPSSIAQKFLGSSLFYGLLALILVGAAIFFVLRTGQNIGSSIPAPDFSVNQKPLENSAELAAPPPPAEAAQVSAETTLSPTAAPPPSETRSPEPTAAPKKTNSLRVTWAEVNKDYFVELFGETLPFGRLRAG